ncbi:MAG: hypothetical protein IPG07_00955 [Crocinitomicaceae bacterium]|jgi:hypothetical protein|nr:hypothetical protein [Crocinitomicaceae bacterium]
MKNLKVLSLTGLMFIGSLGFAGETYESLEAKFKITFPGEFEVESETDEETGTTTISLSCDYNGMLLIGNAFIFEEAISEDDNLYSEAAEVVRICGAFGSKFKSKGLTIWSVGEDTGLINAMKCTGDFKGYIGNYYVIIQEYIEWQFLILGGKKDYDTNLEARFINSFEIIE